MSTLHATNADTDTGKDVAAPLVDRLIDALGRRDFADLKAVLADDVRMRAITPRAVIELDSAAAVATRFEEWFGGSDRFALIEASSGSLGVRQYARWRLRMWPVGHVAAEARVVEQHIFTRGSERVEVLDLLCSGFQLETQVGVR